MEKSIENGMKMLEKNGENRLKSVEKCKIVNIKGMMSIGQLKLSYLPAKLCAFRP